MQNLFSLLMPKLSDMYLASFHTNSLKCYSLDCQKCIEIHRNSTASPNNFSPSLKQCIVGQPEPLYGQKCNCNR